MGTKFQLCKMISSGDVLCNMAPIANNTIIYLQYAEGIDLMLSVCITHVCVHTHKHTQITTKGQEETLGGDGYLYGLDGGNGFMGIYLSPNSLSCTH